ncbi:MAG: CBS domain-containing protein [Clostridiales bacterium]|jgi:CBS domain-containing protein|nr:CBS domain-containing protein [Clostridiales bacterium]
MLVGDIMTDQVISICEDEPVTAAARLIKQNNIGSLPVRDNKGKLKGIVTDRDIVLRCVAAEDDPSDVKVGEIMSRNLVTISSTTDAENAAKVMAKAQIRRVPVTDNGILVGIVALGDLARSSQYEMEAAEALSEISAAFRRRLK